MLRWNKFLLIFLAIALQFSAVAQNEAAKETDGELMKTGGHIYVVLAVVLTILGGLIIYVVRLDNKISKLEKRDV